MAPRATIGFLVGYEGDAGHQYRIYNAKTKKVTIHRDVRFVEHEHGSLDGSAEIMREEVTETPIKITQMNAACIPMSRITRVQTTRPAPPESDLDEDGESFYDTDKGDASFTKIGPLSTQNPTPSPIPSVGRPASTNVLPPPIDRSTETSGLQRSSRLQQVPLQTLNRQSCRYHPK
jgi:hypothetical protein